MVKLDFNIGDLHFKNPVITASGTFGYGSEFDDFVDISRLGGIILKATTLEGREGNPYPRMAEDRKSTRLNSIHVSQSSMPSSACKKKTNNKKQPLRGLKTSHPYHKTHDAQNRSPPERYIDILWKA